MKKRILVLIITTFFLSGCGDKEAREYAGKLVPVLDAYQQELTAKINAEQKSYQRLADAYVDARKDDIIIRLANQRKTQASEVADTVVADAKVPARSEMITMLQDYAKTDFDMTRSLFQEGMDSRSRFLTDVESLEIELQRIKLLKDALTALAKPDSDVKRLRVAAESIAKTTEAAKKLFAADKKSPSAPLKAAVQVPAGDKGNQGTNAAP